MFLQCYSKYIYEVSCKYCYINHHLVLQYMDKSQNQSKVFVYTFIFISSTLYIIKILPNVTRIYYQKCNSLYCNAKDYNNKNSN